jgi:hypothetical protein
MGTVTIDPSYRHMLGKLELLRDPYRSGDVRAERSRAVVPMLHLRRVGQRQRSLSFQFGSDSTSICASTRAVRVSDRQPTIELTSARPRFRLSAGALKEG